MSTRTLLDYLADYRASVELPLSDAYVDQLRNAVRLLERMRGGPVRLCDLSDALLSQYVDWLSGDRSASTVRHRRNFVLALWREAFRQGIVELPPLRVRKVRSGRKLPQAWTREEVATLLQTALTDHKPLKHGVPRGLFLGSLVAAGWDTALRLGDLLRLRHDALPINGAPLIVTQHKTGDQIACTLSSQARGLVDDCYAAGPRSGLIWPLWARREAFFHQVRLLVARAGIRRGTFKWIRRAAITEVEALGGNGALLAGHRSRAVTEAHYIDAAQIPRIVPRPLEIHASEARVSGANPPKHDLERRAPGTYSADYSNRSTL